MKQTTVFETTGHIKDTPLAERVRPQNITEMCGQKKLMAVDSPLRLMIEHDDFVSFILWGPPGTGKTTIAKLIKTFTQHNFHSFSAVFSKIKEVKELMKQASYTHSQQNKKTIVFVDEIHRFNKSQQDAFLPYVESGAIILIGATTENPSFEIIPALLSRCHLFVLEILSEPDLQHILQSALPGIAKKITLSDNALALLAQKAGGDARKALNNLELVCQHAEIGDHIAVESVLNFIGKRSLFYDKRGEEHFNLISAFQKAIRGSDTQGALYWLARMIEAGEDPLYITRRLVRIATEDIGLADPQAILQAIAIKEAVHFLGMPEANTALCQLTVYLATAPKSNATQQAYLKAKKDAIETTHLKVPLSICNAPTQLMKDQGYSAGYNYSHEFKNHYRYQKYFPDSMDEKDYYIPSQFGFEKEITKRLHWWQSLKEQQIQKETDTSKKK